MENSIEMLNLLEFYMYIHKMISNELVDGLVLDSKAEPDLICEPCLAGKMHANSFLSSEHRTTEVLELIHSTPFLA